MKKTIVIGCDNAAVSMKNQLKAYMEAAGYTVEDMGCDSPDDPIYYPYVAAKACQAIIDSGYTKEGVLICGTGLGMAIAQSVVKAHKGFICATDSQGGGLTLTVVLPIAPLEPKIAVDEPPQDAKAERKAERNKAKQEKQQARQHKSE